MSALVLKARMVAATPSKQKSLLVAASGTVVPKRKSKAPSPQAIAARAKLVNED